MTKIKLDGEYQTRDGRPVRVLCVDRIGTQYPVIALVPAVTGPERELFEHYTEEGHTERIGASHLDLIPVPKRHKRTVWVNLYPGERESGIHDNRQVADSCANRERIACLKLDLDFVEGEGL